MISALIMFSFGAGPVKGFAWTLSIGVLTSVFTALFITRCWSAGGTGRSAPSACRSEDPTMHWPLIRLLPKETHFKFVSLAPYAAVLSPLPWSPRSRRSISSG